MKGRWLGGITAAELIARSERFWSVIAHEGVSPKRNGSHGAFPH